VAVLALGASTFEVGLLTVCGTVPFLLVGLPAGAWVDRMRRRRVLIVADLGRALVFASVPLAWAFGALSLWQLYLVTLLAGVLTVFFEVSYQSYLPHLVGRDLLFEGNAKLEAVRGISQLAGPTIAGLLIQAITAPFAVAADALSFALSALFVTRIRGREQKPERAPGTRLIPEIVAGIRFVFGNELLRAIALSVSSYNFFSAIRTAMLIVLLAGELRLGAGTIGLFYSIASSGALLGALSATRIAAKIGQGAAIWVPVAVIAPLQFVIPLVQRGQSLWIAAVAYLLIWFCVSVNNITQVSLRQALTPEPLLGRMTATAHDRHNAFSRVGHHAPRWPRRRRTRPADLTTHRTVDRRRLRLRPGHSTGVLAATARALAGVGGLGGMMATLLASQVNHSGEAGSRSAGSARSARKYRNEQFSPCPPNPCYAERREADCRR
jgi:MFS family permease